MILWTNFNNWVYIFQALIKFSLCLSAYQQGMMLVDMFPRKHNDYLLHYHLIKPVAVIQG